MPVKRKVPDVDITPRTSGRTRRPAPHLVVEPLPDALRPPRVSAPSGEGPNVAGGGSSSPTSASSRHVAGAPAGRPSKLRDRGPTRSIATPQPPSLGREALGRRGKLQHEADDISRPPISKVTAAPGRNSRNQGQHRPLLTATAKPLPSPRSRGPPAGDAGASMLARPSADTAQGRGRVKKPASHAPSPSRGGIGSGSHGGNTKVSRSRSMNNGTCRASSVPPADLEQGRDTEHGVVVGPMGPSPGPEVAPLPEPRIGYTSADIDTRLAEDPGADLGHGARSTILWSEDAFDLAVIHLDPGGYISEPNTMREDIVFVILQGEAEYELHGERGVRALQVGSEAIAPLGSSYTWRNPSDTTGTKISCVVPRVVD